MYGVSLLLYGKNIVIDYILYIENVEQRAQSDLKITRQNYCVVP